MTQGEPRILKALIRLLLLIHLDDVPGVNRTDIERTVFDRYRMSGKRGLIAKTVFWTREISSLISTGISLQIANSKRQSGRSRLFTGFSSDLGFAARNLRKNPTFALGAIAVLALGIGVNTAIFSTHTGMSRIVQRFHDPERLAFLWGVEPGWRHAPVSGFDYLEWRQSATAFGELGASSRSFAYVTGEHEPQRITSVNATVNLLPMLGLEARLGRLFGPTDVEPNSPNVVVLTHRFWVERFAGEQEVLGSTLLLNEIPHTIIGVLPETAEFESLWRNASVYSPLALRRSELAWDHRPYSVIGRLADGSTMEQAQAQLTAIAGRLAEAHPETNADVRVRVEPFDGYFYSKDDKLAIGFLQAAVVAVLLIACVNLANILLAKGTARQGEIAIRLAVGASRWRLVRQLVAESLILALAGGVAGIYLGLVGVRLLMGSFPTQPFLPTEVGLDGTLLSFAILVSVAAALAFGLAPALLATRISLANGVKESMAGASSGRARKRFRSGILVAQLTLTVPLVITCAIAYLNVRALEGVDMGFPRDGLLTLQVDLPTHRYRTAEQQSAFYQDALGAVSTVSGIESAAFGSLFPAGAGQVRTYAPMIIPGRETEEGRSRGPYGFQPVSESYFETLGVRMQLGRQFNSGDVFAEQHVAIVNEAFVRFYWPGEDPLGKQLIPVPLEDETASPLRPITIVGVVKDFGVTFFGEPTGAEIFRPASQAAPASMLLVVRSHADPGIVFPQLREAIRSIDSGIPISRLRTSEKIVDEWLVETRVIAATLGLLGALALALSVVGLYGMVAYSVAQRTYELGIRIVLGADRSAIRRDVLRSFVRLSSIGLTVGLVISIAMAVIMRSQLVMLQVSWLPSVAGIVAILTAVVVLASYLPARRATSIEPAMALRCE